VVVWIALSLLVSTATAFPTSHMSNILASNHARALTQVTCPTGSALNATLGACAIVCAHGYIRDDAWRLHGVWCVRAVLSREVP
jgi:hypothetical protein